MRDGFAGLLLLALGGAQAAGQATLPAPEAAAPSAQAPRMPDPPKPLPPTRPAAVTPDLPPIGYRYAELSSRQTSVLRRGFKLPLEALSTAGSLGDLSRSALVAPLPDPNKPLLAVERSSTDASDPFGERETVSFRDDPLRALGELLGGYNDLGDAAADTDGAPSFTEDAFAAPEAEVSSDKGFDDAAADADDDSDPFGDDGDFEDPFGF